MHNQGLRGTISPRDKTNPAGCQPNISITWGISQQVSFEDFVQVYLAFDKTCQRLKSKHVKCNKKSTIFPKQASNLTEGWSQKHCIGICCNSLHEEIFQWVPYMHRGTPPHRKLLRISVCSHAQIS